MDSKLKIFQLFLFASFLLVVFASQSLGDESFNMICKSNGVIGFTADEKNPNNYRPAKFKQNSYIVIDSVSQLEKIRELNVFKDTEKILLFKDDDGSEQYYHCRKYLRDKNNESFNCTFDGLDKILLNIKNLRYTKVYGNGWVAFSGDSISIEYGVCSRME